MKNKNTYYVIAVCARPSLKTKYGEYPFSFKSRTSARQKILSFSNGWGIEILDQPENYQNKPMDCWKTKNRWLIIEKK